MSYYRKPLNQLTQKELGILFSISEEKLPLLVEENILLYKVFFLNSFTEICCNGSYHRISTLKNLINNVIFQKSDYQDSWLFGDGITHKFLVLDLMKVLMEANLLSENELINIILSHEPLISFDFRGRIGSLFIKKIHFNDMKILNSTIKKIQTFLNTFTPASCRTLDEKSLNSDNNNSYFFPIPNTLEGKINLIQQATEYKVKENIFIDLVNIMNTFSGREKISKSVFELINTDNFKEKSEFLKNLLNSSGISHEASRLVDKDLSCQFHTWENYIVPWNQHVAYFTEGNYSYQYTISELLRILRLTPELALPDINFHNILLSFYRSVLKISSGVHIGTKENAIHMDYRSEENPSLFYMSRNAVIGENCFIESSGEVALLSNSSLENGAAPLIIRTHKSIFDSIDTKGNSELEKTITVPDLLLAEKNTSLAFSEKKPFDTVDYIDEPPYGGH